MDHSRYSRLRPPRPGPEAKTSQSSWTMSCAPIFFLGGTSGWDPQDMVMLALGFPGQNRWFVFWEDPMKTDDWGVSPWLWKPPLNQRNPRHLSFLTESVKEMKPLVIWSPNVNNVNLDYLEDGNPTNKAVSISKHSSTSPGLRFWVSALCWIISRGRWAELRAISPSPCRFCHIPRRGRVRRMHESWIYRSQKCPSKQNVIYIYTF